MSGRGLPATPADFRDRHGHRVLSLTGDLDIGVRDAVVEALREHIEVVGSSVIIVDLSAVTFMDSAGLDPLLRIHAELAELDRVLTLQSISRPVERLFRLLDRIRPYDLVQQTLHTSPTRDVAGPAADDPGGEDLRPSQARNLQAAMHAHALLNEANGLLMAVHDCNAEQARLLLELVASHRHFTVADLAAGIVAAADATAQGRPGVGLAAMVPAGVRAALSTHIPAPRTAPEATR